MGEDKKKNSGRMQVTKGTISILLALAACSAASLLTAGCAGLQARPGDPTASAPHPDPGTPQGAETSSAAVASVAAAPMAALSATPSPPPRADLEAPPLGPANLELEGTEESQSNASLAQTQTGPDSVAASQQAGSQPVPGTSSRAAPEDPTPEPQYADLWERIRAGFALSTLDDPRVEYHLRWFTSNPDYMLRKTERARLYLYYIVEEVEKRGMPMEIALLPAIESAYQPHAYSRARALGLWQFIAPTARRYGITMNWWYDGRRDVLASTRAALDYLEELYQEFGDWHLALAAYNAGEGKVRYLLAYNQHKGLPTDYQHLRLRAETKHYVPKLLAFVSIIADPSAYGITLADIPNEPYFAPLELDAQIDLNVVARLADVPIGDLYDINPGLNRWATAPDGPHRILVPIDKRDALIESLSNLPEDSWVRWQHHRVQRADTLSTIARRYGVTVWTIQHANGLRGTLIREGQDLMIPISARPLTRQMANVTRPPAPQPPPASKGRVVHHVRPGDTLWSIARRYGVYVSQLTKWNLIEPGDILRIGQQLNVFISPSF